MTLEIPSPNHNFDPNYVVNLLISAVLLINLTFQSHKFAISEDGKELELQIRIHSQKAQEKAGWVLSKLTK